MEGNPFKKIITGLATITALSHTSAEGISQIENPTENPQSHTKEMSVESNKLIKSINEFEKKFAAGKEVKKLEMPTIAVYSANDILHEKSFNLAPEYNSDFWASQLEVELVDSDKKHGYLERSSESIAAIEKENLLQYDGVIDEESSKTRMYVKPDQYLVVSVNQVDKAIIVNLFDSKTQSINSSVSVLIENDLDATQTRLTQKVCDLLGQF